MAFKIHLTQFAVVVMISKLQLISFLCPHYSNERSTFLNTVRNISRNIFDKNDLKITETLLYGDSSLDDKSNTLMLYVTMDFLFVTKRFDVNLL